MQTRPKKLLFLGTGSAFTVGEDNFQSNMLLMSEFKKNLLIDCGTDIRFSLHEQGMTYQDITDVFITHLHADHAGGLQWLALNNHFFAEKHSKPKLFIHRYLVDDLWHKVLAGGLDTLQGENARLESYFNVHIIEPNQHFVWEDVQFQPIQMLHFYNGFCIAPTFGLLFDTGQTKVLISADTQFGAHQLTDFYQMADIIFNDCETDKKKSGVHCRFTELSTLDKTIKSRMWLYHYSSGELPDAKKAGFKGFVKKGQIFEIP